MSLATPTSKPKFNGKLSHAMLLLIIPIALVPIIIVGSIAYFGAKDLLQKQSYAQLATIERNAESQIDSWIAEKHIFLHNTVRTNQLSSYIQELFTLEAQGAEYTTTGEKILTELNQANNQSSQSNFNHFVVVNQTGEILTSSIADWVGETIEDKQFFTSLNTEAIRSKIVYRLDPFAASEVVILTAAPIFAEDTSYLGAVIAVTRGDELRLFLQTAQIYPSSQAYFVNADKTYLVVTKLLQTIARLEPSESQKQTIETGLAECLENDEYSLKTKYLSFNSEPVLGTFLWIPEINTKIRPIRNNPPKTATLRVANEIANTPTVHINFGRGFMRWITESPGTIEMGITIPCILISYPVSSRLISLKRQPSLERLG
ncbi:MAG: cache domain-containing protein [Chloroflexota bacterium]|nr:cache domain-containing protein [Chloroflexota bacterium]